MAEKNDRFHYTIRNIREEIVTLCPGFYRITYCWGLKPNTLIVTGADGVLVVDPGQRSMADRLKKAISAISSKPVVYIVNTHPHGDHIGANKAFCPPARLITFDSLYSYHEMDFLKYHTPAFPGCKEERITGSFSFSFYDTRVLLIPAPGIHSDKDMLVYFPVQGIVHIGDLLLTETFPVVGYKVKEYLQFLGTVQKVFPENTLFVGGHGRELDMASLSAYREMLESTVNIIRSEKKKGRSMTEVMENDVLNPWSSYGSYIKFITKDFWIESVWRSYGDRKSRLFEWL
ncbi:MAG: MBL fold metallo-hydrolase [Bacteroidetes bacterium]|nr:MBL fold metallo-hydrolase [Bacteroidota bacterium]